MQFKRYNYSRDDADPSSTCNNLQLKRYNYSGDDAGFVLLIENTVTRLHLSATTTYSRYID